MGAGQEDLGAALLFTNIHDIRTNAIARLDVFTRQSLIATDHGLSTAQINNDVAIFDALDDAVDDLADTVFKLFILTRAFCFACNLHDGLLGAVCLNAGRFNHR